MPFLRRHPNYKGEKKKTQIDAIKLLVCIFFYNKKLILFLRKRIIYGTLFLILQQITGIGSLFSLSRAVDHEYFITLRLSRSPRYHPTPLDGDWYRLRLCRLLWRGTCFVKWNMVLQTILLESLPLETFWSNSEQL